MTKLVVIESPYAGDIDRNVRYARLCCLDSLDRDEYPFASHLFYPQIIDDGVPILRQLGMDAGFAWGACAPLVAVYTDLGITRGMERGMAYAAVRGQQVICRALPAHLMEKLDE